MLAKGGAFAIYLNCSEGFGSEFFKDLMGMVKKLEIGQGLVEYAFILILVAIFLIVALSLFGPTIGGIYSNIVLGLSV